ncbi:MAG TPA: hypothetical protein DD622_07210 [Opitutae bacterium]|nr:hypothetical protein [Opitutae bacterium]|tara:strand:- start:91 stop:846 length:756 start_codon:yes stop_codon:yes gene_type:complete
MKVLSYIFFVFITAKLTFFSSALCADSFLQGITAYELENYELALIEFEAAVKDSPSAAAHHNLGLTYLKLNQLPDAIWQIETALRLDPHNDQYAFKLTSLREQRLGIFQEPVPKYLKLARLLQINQWIVTCTICAWILLVVILMPKFTRYSTGAVLQLLLIISCCILPVGITAIVINYRAQAGGIIMAEAPIELRSAPASAAPQTGNARPAERAKVIDYHNEYIKVKTEGQATGWIPKKAFRSLKTSNTDA